MKVSDMFPSRVLRGSDLPEKGMLIQITGVHVEKMRAGQGKPEETKYVLYFDDVSTGKPARVRGVQYVPEHGQGLVLRKALAIQINEATHTDDTDDWTGKRVVIYGCKTKAQGKEVVSICARAPKTEATGANANGKAPTTTPTTTPTTEATAA